MRKLLSIILILATLTALARQWTPAEVPNVLTADSTRYTSDPDAFLSHAARMRADSICRAVRTQTSAQIAVVILDSIAGDDPQLFSTQLFRQWGIGNQDNDNGLLFLIVPGQHAAQLTTGYGLEGILPDVTCSAIVRNLMFPAYREGDWDNGTLAGLEAAAAIVSDPENAEEIRSAYLHSEESTINELLDFLKIYVSAGLAAGLLIILFMLWLRRRNKALTDHGKYIAMAKYRPWILMITAVFAGSPLIGAIPYFLTMKHLRNHRRNCPNCGTEMKKLDEASDNAYLNPGQDLEEKLGSVDYDVWLCPKCGETDILPYVSSTTTYTPCPRCGVRAYSLVRQRVLRQPTSSTPGILIKEYRCRACGHGNDEQERIDPTPDASIAAGAVLGSMLGGRGGGGGFGGGGFGGGSFGGGSTGGGGFGGRW